MSDGSVFIRVIRRTTKREAKADERVLYVPHHAEGDVNHRDCEAGTISSFGPNGVNVRVKFDKRVARLGWAGTTAEACDPEDLLLLGEET